MKIKTYIVVFLFLINCNTSFGQVIVEKNACDIYEVLKTFIVKHEKRSRSDFSLRIAGIDNNFKFPIFDKDLCKMPNGIYGFSGAYSHSVSYTFTYNENCIVIIEDYKMENFLSYFIDYLSNRNYTNEETKIQVSNATLSRK